MVYMIAHFEVTGMTMDLMKKGNKYQIWVKSGTSMTNSKEFETIDEAVIRFNELACSGYMMRRMFLSETKKEILAA